MQGSTLTKIMVILTTFIFLSLLIPKASIAVTGDFKATDFTAAAPFTYNHSTGGGAYNDRTVGDFDDVTEQLEGGQFACGDIVTYLAQVEMEASTVETVQTARFSFRFLADSTGQSGAAHSAVVGVSINYGPVENGDDGTGTNPGAGSYGLDSGISDDGGSTAIFISQQLTGPLFTAGSELLAEVDVSDLEAGERVVLRIDVQLECQPNTSPTGNLQGQLDTGITYPSGDTINTGQQTIPFLRIGDLAGAGEPLLIIQKTVTTENGTCGNDDVEELTITAGDTVKYCYSVNNPGTSDLFDVSLTDDNGTPGNTSDDFTVTLSGLADLDGEADLGDLASGDIVTGEALVTLTIGGTVINTADAIGNNGRSGGNYAELTDSDTSTVIVEGIPNRPPEANDDNATTDEDTSVTIDAAANDTDPDGNLDPTTATVLSGPSNGTVVNNSDGTFTYTPNENFNGTDSFTYQICDTNGLCDQATVTINVTPVNDPPVANDDSYSTPEDTTLTVPAPGILGNDSDVDGDSLTVNLLTNPSNGTLSQNADGSFTYTPNENFNGTDSYTYEACDPGGLCDQATVTIDVTPVNDPPIANDDQAVTDEDTPVVIDITANDNAGPADEDQTLTVTQVSDPSNGTVTVNPDGTVTYTPDPDFSGTDTFTYTVCDSEGLCDTATVTVIVNPSNDPPVANDDSATTNEDTPVTIDAAANDTDLDGNLDPSSATVDSGPSNGTVVNNGDGTFTYTPNENFYGQDEFTYQICDDGTPDGQVLCDTATVTIDVLSVNDPPVALDDSYSTPEDTTLTVPAPGILGNDS